MKRIFNKFIPIFISIILLISLYFFLLDLSYIRLEFIKNNKNFLSYLLLSSYFILLLAYFFTYKKGFNVINKGILILLFILLAISIGYYIIASSGFIHKFNSVEDFRNYVASFKGASIIVFILLQYLQVIILPIPSIIMTGAGVLLFGSIKGAIFSILGIVLGSITAYFIGKIFGVKAVKWIVGEEALNKAIKSFGKTDRVLLPFMFLFPFFPDDLLCFISGLTTIKPLYFIVMVFITRSIAIFFSSLSLGNNLIPFDTWWGILSWCFIFAITVFLAFFLTNKANKITNKLSFNKSK